MPSSTNLILQPLERKISSTSYVQKDAKLALLHGISGNIQKIKHMSLNDAIALTELCEHMHTYNDCIFLNP